ncbi:MAG: outer membrane protein, partial [Nitrospiraceae bacterium]
FPQATNPTNPDALGQLVQSFSTSDVSLKSSLIFGGKAGYFFSNEGVSWLGIELEAFTSNPTIKQQTLTTKQDITYTPNKDAGANLCSQPPGIKPPNCPASVLTNSTLSLNESDLRVTTVAFNIIARYPDDTFQPYIGIGAGAFYFSSKTGSIQGTQVVPGLNALAGVKVLITEEWGIFAEGKYNRATLSGFDPTFGLSGEYSVFHAVGGIAYHF